MLRHAVLIATAAVVAQFTWGSPAAAADTAGADSANPAQTQALAGQRLQDMAKWLAAQQSFTVTMRADYDVPQESGQMIEFGEVRNIAVQRPDQARIEQRASDGRRDLLLFDGEHITVLDATANVFAQAPTTGEDLDDAIRYLLDSLQLRLPLAPLLMTSFPQELQRNVVEAELVESTDLLGPTTDHIAARTQQVDFQVWIAQGEQPWPLRIVITYRLQPGSPQFRANLSQWNRSPKFDQQAFVFQQPAGATRIPFAAQFLTEPTDEETGAASTTGDQP
jgi:hypothetical protein